MKKQDKVCQYNFPNCQKTADFQHIKKLGAISIDKSWICANCKEVLKAERKSHE